MKNHIQDFLNDEKMSKEEKVSKLYNYFVDGTITNDGQKAPAFRGGE